MPKPQRSHDGAGFDAASHAIDAYARRALLSATEPPGAHYSLSMDQAVVDKLVANHRAFLSFLERRVGSRAEAEDLLQEAFVKGLDHADALRDEESAVAWFYRVLRNALIDRQRRRGAAGRALEAFAREIDGVVEPSPDLKNAACECVRRLADTLKPEYAEALRRIEVDGLTVQGYAREAGIEPNNAAVRVHRARAALRKQVMISCRTCAEHGCLDCTCSR